MKALRFAPIMCVLTLLSYASVYAAPKPERGVNVTSTSAPADPALHLAIFGRVGQRQLYSRYRLEK